MGVGLTVNELQSTTKTKGLLDIFVHCILDFSSWLAGEITQDFLWFSVLHGWWRSNLIYNVVYSTADPDQDFAAQAAAMFKMQLDFPMVGSSISSHLSLIDLSLTYALTPSNLPSHKDVTRGNDLLPLYLTDVDDGTWNLNNMFAFDNLDMDFSFTDPSMPPTTLLSVPMSTVPTTNNTIATHIDMPAAAPLPAPLSTTPITVLANPIIPLKDDDGYYPPHPPCLVPATPSTAHVTPTDPAVILQNDDNDYCPRPSFLVPTTSSTMHVTSTNPTVISLNDDDETLHTAGGSADFLKAASPSATISTDDSDSDAAATALISHLDLMKHKTSTPEVSFEEMKPGSWFSTDPSPSTTSKLSCKHAWLLAADSTNPHNMSTSIMTTVRALQEQKTLEHHANRDERAVAYEEWLVNKKKQCKHEWDMLQQQQAHETHMAVHQQTIVASEEQVKGKSEVEPEHGEGDDFMTG
ncbi:hypothetical protein HD554DRAFT_2176865 [Boletus coccyginus]|nr:hypothetical protein HD554DRAFT_2176865 [Boletus coccyginus]